MSLFEVGDRFYLDGRPFRIIAGAMHYFRVPRAYWRDRLLKLRAMGCNTVETYVPWNLHEPNKGSFSFSGNLDIAAYLRLAQELGLYALVRPSPYICAEWEFGGLPAWLLVEDNLPLRTSDDAFMSHVQTYYQRLFRELTPLQITKSGPILMLQVENEYGAWLHIDISYLKKLRDYMRTLGIEVPLFTSDDFEHLLPLPGTLTTINFGSGAAERLPLLEKHTVNKPKMVGEFWVGWFDAWGEEHHTNSAQKNAQELEAILASGASVNLYMFHGGTNPGFMNGANDYGHISPDTTSYDYDAPLAEDGSVTPKYFALQEVISRYASFDTTLPPALPHTAYGTVQADGQISLADALMRLAMPKRFKNPVSMEKLGQSYGYTLYTTVVEKESRIEAIRFEHCADRAQVFIDGEWVRTLYDRELQTEFVLGLNAGRTGRISVLTENLGRVNYGAAMEQQRKGIDGSVYINGRLHENWEAYRLELTPLQLSRLVFDKPGETKMPGFTHFTFQADTPCDTFLVTEGWGKGCAFINGVNLGRFWDIGPQRRLFVPAPLLRKGKNELIMFETEGKIAPTVCFE